ncbi:acyl-CoA dehydrogenase [Desulfatibacillum aliphaticivorans]|uniref:acyl-CoA dehydrogenase n=1 Tax=Desulfatibacillum aliphaticivorans TaxID=218208 RepID=UPI00041F2205|nr:acyl-CoA dehydrogenase [Desulfatibacillum aliphaticivorans]
MAQVIADRRDIEFVLYEQLEADKINKHKEYSDLDKKSLDLIITEARNLALKELLPINSEADKTGLRFENNQVFVPEVFHKPFKILAEDGWGSVTEDPELGGQGLPTLIMQPIIEYLMGACGVCLGYVTMGHGTGKMIELFGTEKQKELYLKNLYSAKWGGTMVLTEAEAGSDVGNLSTTAKKNDDGTYSITGNKIFITYGEHDLTENIIHPVLARIEGAPAGTAGISIFIVPKIWVNDDGSLGEPNDVVCTGIEEKMGIHASATCSLAFGGKGQCRGYLLGEENKGMKVMFLMMNEARLNVGFQGFSAASVAYMYACNYAKERIQGRALEDSANKDAKPVAIINHPDVRRNLLTMKAYTDGMRSFIYYVADLFDKEELAESPEEADRFNKLIQLYTPVIKAYCTDKGFELASTGIQVYGGYGYISEYPMEQILRDAKIGSIYEGTNGIQAMDLIGRKLGMDKGAIFMSFMGEVAKTVAQAKAVPGLEDMAAKVEAACNRLGETAMHLGKTAVSPQFKAAFAHSTHFLEAMGDVIMAWMLLWRAVISAPKIEKQKKAVEKEYYEGQVKTAEFFIFNMLPVTMGKMDSITITNPAALEIADSCFGG